jgi:hypothetical protein
VSPRASCIRTVAGSGRLHFYHEEFQVAAPQDVQFSEPARCKNMGTVDSA